MFTAKNDINDVIRNMKFKIPKYEVSINVNNDLL